MERIVQKFSVVYVATAEKTEIFRSIEEMPEDIRLRLVRAARSSQVDTLVIANEKGREMLQSEGWPAAGDKSDEPPAQALPKSLRWGIIMMLAGAVGLVMTLMLQYR